MTSDIPVSSLTYATLSVLSSNSLRLYIPIEPLANLVALFYVLWTSSVPL